MFDRNVRIHSFHPGSVLMDAVRTSGMNEESMAWDDAQLPGQSVVWLASKEATFLKGIFVWASWDVQELVERKGEFESDPELLKVGVDGGLDAVREHLMEREKQFLERRTRESIDSLK